MDQYRGIADRIVTTDFDGTTLDLSCIAAKTVLLDATNKAHADLFVDCMRNYCAGMQNLILSSNGLTTLSAWTGLNKIPTLKRIYLVDNGISDVSAFDGITLDLLTLHLAENPIFLKLGDRSVVAALREKFPSLSRIDGGIVNGGASAKYVSIANMFIANYIRCFDTPNSMIEMLYQCKGSRLSVFTHPSVRTVIGVYHNRDYIDSALKKFPRTTHDPPESIQVVTMDTPSGLQITVIVFGDITIDSKKHPYIRRFILEMEPRHPLGVMILDDQLYINKAIY